MTRPDSSLHPLAEQGAGPGRVLAEEVQVDGQEGQALVQVVVQLAGDPPAFRFLGLEQPAGQAPQLALALAQALLRPSPIRTFHQQADDQQGLSGANGDRTDDLPFVEIPEARRLIQDDRLGRQPLLSDAPAFQLRPVDHGRVLGRFGEPMLSGSWPAKTAQRHVRRVRALGLEARDAAADDPASDVRAVMAVDRCVRRGRDSTGHSAGM